MNSAERRDGLRLRQRRISSKWRRWRVLGVVWNVLLAVALGAEDLQLRPYRSRPLALEVPTSKLSTGAAPAVVEGTVTADAPTGGEPPPAVVREGTQTVETVKTTADIAPAGTSTEAAPVEVSSPSPAWGGTLLDELFSRSSAKPAPTGGTSHPSARPPPPAIQWTPVVTQDSPAHVRLEEAIALAREQKHEQAIRLLEEILKDDPSLTAAWEQLGWSYWALGRREDARVLWRQLLALDPRSPVPYMLLARAAAAENRLDEAIEYNRTALALAPNNASVKFDLARTLLWKGDSAQAMKLLDELVSADPNRPDVVAEYARALTFAWRFDQALPLWQRLRATAQDNPTYMSMEALCRLHTNDPEGARELATRTLELVPDDLNALEVLASIAEFSPQPAEAVPRLRALIAAAKTPSDRERYRSRLIRLLVRLHRKEPRVYGLREAIDLARERRAEMPHSADARLLLAELLMMDGMLPEAEREFIGVLKERNPYNIRARKGLLETYLAAKQYELAREQLTALSRFNPHDPYLLYHLARIESSRGDFHTAHEALDRLEAIGQQGAVAVLLYHGLTQSHYFSDALPVDRLREHMVALQKAKARFVRASELNMVLQRTGGPTNPEPATLRPVLSRSGRPGSSGVAPRLTVCVTFDDGRKDSMSYGTRVAKELGLVFSMHVPVGYILQQHPFICSWDELRQYQKEGCWEFGGHMLNGSILAPVDSSGRLWHPLPNLLWRTDLGRLETLEEYEQRLAAEFSESREILRRELGGPVNFVAYPFGDIGQEDETNVDDPISRILNHARRRFEIGFIQSVFGYAIAGDNPWLYQRYEPDRDMTGQDLVDYLYEHHPVFLARRLRAEFAAQEGKLYLARRTLESLEADGYPERPLQRVREYVESRLARPFGTPLQGPGTITKSPWTIEPRKPYVGVEGEYFRDNQDRRNGRIFGLAGLNLTPNLVLEGRAGIGFLQQDVHEAITNIVRRGRRFSPVYSLHKYSLDVDERDVGLRAMFTFPNGIYVAGDLLQRAFSGDADRTVVVGSLEGQLRPIPLLDLQLRYERDMAPSALAVVEDIAYHMFMGAANVRLTDTWTLLGSAVHYDFSDDNTRDHFAIGTSWTLHERTGFRVGLRASYDTSDFESRAYWTPYHLQRYYVETGFRGQYLRMYYNLRLRLGIGREDVRPEEEERYRLTVARAIRERFEPGPPPQEDWEPVLGLAASFRKPIGEHWSIHGEASYNRNPNYNEFSLLGGLRYRF